MNTTASEKQLLHTREKAGSKGERKYDYRHCNKTLFIFQWKITTRETESETKSGEISLKTFPFRKHTMIGKVFFRWLDFVSFLVQVGHKK